MELEEDTNLNIFFKNIQKQFLCCYPLHCILWQEFPKNLGWDEQKILMEYTFLCPLNKQFPIKLSYQQHFLKKLLLLFEENGLEIHDIVYEIYCKIQQKLAEDCTKKYAFKHYYINTEVKLTLRESKSFVAEGTTGLCSWQASLALADFLTKNSYIIRDKNILELGAGTGLCGLTILKICEPKHVLLSDGSSACVELIRENLKFNFPEALEKNHEFMINSRIAECAVISWENIKNKNEVIVLKPDIIIAADVVYDDSSFKDLSSAINFVFELKHDKAVMYLAATLRNQHTLNKFINIIESLRFQISECDVIPLNSSDFYWDRTTPVKIIKFTK